MLEELLRAGMAVARFNFSHGSYEYHQVRLSCNGCCHCLGYSHISSSASLQETLDNLRTAMKNTRIMCAVMLDTKVLSACYNMHMWSY